MNLLLLKNIWNLEVEIYLRQDLMTIILTNQYTQNQERTKTVGAMRQIGIDFHYLIKIVEQINVSKKFKG